MVSSRWVWLVGVGGIYGCGYQEVDVVGICVASGCGCKEVYRFPHITYPYSSCIFSFLKQHPFFLLNVFRLSSGSYFL